MNAAVDSYLTDWREKDVGVNKRRMVHYIYIVIIKNYNILKLFILCVCVSVSVCLYAHRMSAVFQSSLYLTSVVWLVRPVSSD